jgi:hypothetical protein
VAWLFGSLVTYFVLGLLEDFYPAAWMLILWGIFYQTLSVVFFYYLIRDAFMRFHFAGHGLGALVMLAAFLFGGAVVWLVFQYPNWCDTTFLLLNVSDTPWFAALSLLSIFWTFALLWFFRNRGWEQAILSGRAFEFLRANLPGLLLALAFFIAYFSLTVTFSLVLRDPARNFDDNFYDTDPTSWMNRFAAPVGQLVEMRPVHPLAFLIFRPLTWLLSIFLNGDRFYAALLLNAGAGALCVLLAWMLVRRWTNSTYALLIASLLGAGAAHLILSTFIETYIFSAAALIAFLLVMQSRQGSLAALVPVGLLTFGITVTNFIQTGILLLTEGAAHAPSGWSIRQGSRWSASPAGASIVRSVKYAVIVLALALPLAWLQFVVYPTSQPFYDVRQMLAEDRYSTGLTTMEHMLERSYSLGRTMVLYSTVGPRPLALTREIGCYFPCFKTYKPEYGPDTITSYAGFGSGLARTWFGIIILAFGLFAWKLYKAPKSVSLEIGLLLCLLFNFILHVVYGDDPMLYSPDWVYALIFFVALAFKDFADKRWFQAAGLVFLAALIINNWTFLRAMLEAVAPYF